MFPRVLRLFRGAIDDLIAIFLTGPIECHTWIARRKVTPILQIWNMKGFARFLVTFPISFFLPIVLLLAQEEQPVIVGIHTLWDDNFKEWEIYFVEGDSDDLNQGELRMKWPLRNSWDEWTFYIGDLYGEIRTKWQGDFSQWEIRCDGDIVTVRQKWRNDPNEWVIRNGTTEITLTTEYRNNANSWIAGDDAEGLVFYTEYLNDPRDWIVEDYLLPEVNVSFKLGILFPAIFQAIPK